MNSGSLTPRPMYQNVMLLQKKKKKKLREMEECYVNGIENQHELNYLNWGEKTEQKRNQRTKTILLSTL